MPDVIDEDAWLAAMRDAALPAIRLAAEQFGDPAAAGMWEESEHALHFERPGFVRAIICFSRPDSLDELPDAGENALTFDYLPYVLAGPRRLNPLVDMGIRRSVLAQVRGRLRDAEIARLSPEPASHAWACTLDVMTWTVLSTFLAQEKIESIVTTPLERDEDDGDDRPPVAIERNWHPYNPGPDALGLHCCNLVPDMGTLATDGLEFRLGGRGSPVMRVESTSSGNSVHIEVRGVSVPETALVGAEGRPLSRLIDDAALLPATRLLTVREVSNRTTKDEAFLSVVCDEVRIRCAPAPEGADFAWERLRDPAAPLGRPVRILDHGALAR